ncbi:hypothetical protein F4808DRAFT_70728 [Astrocystis sublimbata]|nr:hypothetical protein F4808DRAFT_70728 [Astrocystis sublimbata]
MDTPFPDNCFTNIDLDSAADAHYADDPLTGQPNYISGNFGAASEYQITSHEILPELGPISMYLDGPRHLADDVTIQPNETDLCVYQDWIEGFALGGVALEDNTAPDQRSEDSPTARQGRVPPRKATRIRGRATRCLNCWLKRRKCTRVDRSCHECIRAARLPLCIQHRLEHRPLFDKWHNPNYREQMKWPSLAWTGEPFSLYLCHFLQGPNLGVTAQKFLAIDDGQILVWGKTNRGWQSIPTSPIGLATLPSDKAIGRYIEDCIPLCYQMNRSKLLDAVWQLKEIELVSLALRLWTANFLLMRGWECPLGEAIDDPRSPYHQKRPAPRVIQNQLDAIIERYMAICEASLLQRLERGLKDRSQLDAVCAVSIVLMSILEKDIWRLMFWTRHPEEVYKWRHPDSPESLIRKDVAYANVLLTIACIVGHLPDRFAAIGDGFSGVGDYCTPYLSYCEINDKSIDGSATRLMMMPGSGRMLSEAEFLGA